MRSYWLSLTLVAGLLLGYTAIVLNSHGSMNGPNGTTPRASADLEPREPATAAQVTTTPETSSESVN